MTKEVILVGEFWLHHFYDQDRREEKRVGGESRVETTDILWSGEREGRIRWIRRRVTQYIFQTSVGKSMDNMQSNITSSSKLRLSSKKFIVK